MNNLALEDRMNFVSLFNSNSIADTLKQDGFVLIAPEIFSAIVSSSLLELNNLKTYWHNLPLDSYLKDGGNYRHRRHASYTISNNKITTVPCRAHWQFLENNQLNGGIQRWYDPLEENLSDSKSWQNILLAITQLLNLAILNLAIPNLVNSAPAKWFVEAHQFRINTMSGIGLPTPEGVHRDGADFVAIILVDRAQIKGGESRIFYADGTACFAKILTDPWTLLMIDDTRMLHETTPITSTYSSGYRDTLVLTYRRSGFQEPAY